MRMPIQYALSYPDRWKNDLASVNLTQIRKLEFFEPDLTKFPCLHLAQEALRIGGTMTAVLNAANEVAVENFLAERISFPCIHRVVEGAMEKHSSSANPSLEDVLEADRWARQHAGESVVQMQA
jgi:1-deoxy-D-xylulose-5-phosphate reductoisomerase